MSNKFTGELISIKFTDRKNPVYGFVIDYNEDWTLMKYNPVDYVMDGYIILRHKNIKGFQKNEEEKFKEKVIKLKKQSLKRNENIPITDLQTILSYLTKKFGVFQLSTKSESACYLGRLKSFDQKQFVIDCLDTKGKWKGQMKFRSNDIRTIEFQTDYINSLKLLAGK
jgi:hypothetical protein